MKQKKEPSTQNYLTYTNEEYGYGFDYPKSWKTSDAVNDRGVAPGMPKYNSLTIESADLATTNEGIGFHLTSGAEMFVAVQETNAATPDALLATRTLENNVATNREAVKVDGQNALRYKLQYETSPSLTTLVLKNGKGYFITLNYADDTALTKYKAEYENLVKSFKVTE